MQLTRTVINTSEGEGAHVSGISSWSRVIPLIGRNYNPNGLERALRARGIPVNSSRKGNNNTTMISGVCADYTYSVFVGKRSLNFAYNSGTNVAFEDSPLQRVLDQFRC